jgi:hypothetical protein
LVGSVVCCVQLFGEEVYGKEQTMEGIQKRVGKEWIRVQKEHLQEDGEDG